MQNEIRRQWATQWRRAPKPSCNENLSQLRERSSHTAATPRYGLVRDLESLLRVPSRTRWRILRLRRLRRQLPRLLRRRPLPRLPRRRLPPRLPRRRACALPTSPRWSPLQRRPLPTRRLSCPWLHRNLRRQQPRRQLLRPQPRPRPRPRQLLRQSPRAAPRPCRWRGSRALRSRRQCTRSRTAQPSTWRPGDRRLARRRRPSL